MAVLLLSCALASSAHIGLARAFVLPEGGWQTYATAAVPQQGWAWQVQRSQLPSLGAFSGVPETGFAVAWLGQPDKFAYLGIGASETALQAATLELTVDTAAMNQSVETAQVRGCAIVSPWEPGGPIAWDRKPISVCDTSTKGTYDADAHAFRFPLAPLAGVLSSAGMHGISIEPVESPSGLFQVVFKGVEGGGVRIAKTANNRRSGSSEAGSALAGGAFGPGPLPIGPNAGVASVPRPSADEAALSLSSARPTEEPSLPRGRPFGMGGVYAALIALATLPLAGRVLGLGFFRKDEDR